MANLRPFTPVAGATKPVSVTTTAAATKLTDGAGEYQVRVRNLSASASDAYLRFGGSSVGTSASATADIGVSPGTVEVFTVIAGTDGLYVSAVCASGTASLEISVGSGF